ncbi:MAG TPA: hypothetical protein VF175_08975 [Lacipirellula sp.]
MRRIYLAIIVLLASSVAPALAAEPELGSEMYRLTPGLEKGDAADVTVTFEVGGELIVPDDKGKDASLPMSVVAKMAYEEQLVAWWNDPAIASRSLRRYSEARATLKSAEKGETRELPGDLRVIAAKAGADDMGLNGLTRRLTREQYDLINIPGNSLLIDRLLPKREMAVGEHWDHNADTIAGLFGMSHVAVCEVRSTVTGMDNRQVQIRMAGTVHGTVEGAATEIDVRGAYLFHLDHGRITKMNLALKEVRKPGEVTPGLDVVAKLSLVATPISKGAPRPFDEELVDECRALSTEELSELQFESPSRGYRFRHDSAWYVTGEQREHMSLRRLQRDDFIAHCNITTLPIRPANKPMTLHEFEANVVKSLGDKLDNVEAATEWANDAGHQCLGVIATGTIEDVPMQWRYYMVAAEGQRPATISVTAERSLLERFSDADRAIIDSMVLIDDPTATAAKPLPVKK